MSRKLRTPESTVQKDIFSYLVSQNFLVIRVNSGAISQQYKGRERYITFVRWQAAGRKQTAKGIADIVALAPWGQLFAVECKAVGKIGRTSDAQAEFLDAAEARGAVAIIADRVEDVITAIELHRPDQDAWSRQLF
jgi:hypothetical protein